MGQAAEGAAWGTAFHLFRLAFLRLAKLDLNCHRTHLLLPRSEPPSSSRMRCLFPKAAGGWAAPRCAGGAARVRLRSAFRNLRSAFRNLRSAFRSCVLCSAAFCVQLRSESCIQLRSAFSCVLCSGFYVLRSTAFAFTCVLRSGTCVLRSGCCVRVRLRSRSAVFCVRLRSANIAPAEPSQPLRTSPPSRGARGRHASQPQPQVSSRVAGWRAGGRGGTEGPDPPAGDGDSVHLRGLFCGVCLRGAGMECVRWGRRTEGRAEGPQHGIKSVHVSNPERIRSDSGIPSSPGPGAGGRRGGGPRGGSPVLRRSGPREPGSFRKLCRVAGYAASLQYRFPAPRAGSSRDGFLSPTGLCGTPHPAAQFFIQISLVSATVFTDSLLYIVGVVVTRRSPLWATELSVVGWTVGVAMMDWGYAQTGIGEFWSTVKSLR
eukprot:gene13260-biopygen974